MAGAFDLSRFECRRCGACCRIKDGIVRLSDAEIQRIAGFLGMSEADFIENETVLSPDRRCLVLKDAPDGGCAMLDERGLCRIHPVKPDKCRTFPYEWTNADSAEYCPGLRDVSRDSGFTVSAPVVLPGDGRVGRFFVRRADLV